jgi:Protein of unknown function (DUF1501)
MFRHEWTPTQRRDFLQTIARTTLGVSFAGGLAFGTSEDAVAAVASTAKAKHIIYLFMDGAMTHLDTFDPKTGVPQAGETKPIPTRVPGIQFGDRFPKLAELAGGLAVIRSMSTETGDHEKGRYLMRTGYKQINSIRHPSMGSHFLAQKGRISKELPGNYLIGGGNRHPGAGFLEPSLSPVPIANANAGLQNTQLPKYLEETAFNRRLMLASKFDQSFQKNRINSDVEAYNQLYQEARQLIGSSHLKVFDIKEESQEVRDAYGASNFGQGCLLARRLVQSGARFVEVSLGGWDMHQELYEKLDTLGGELDQGLSSLLRDLHAKGLLQETLVVLTTEFGRKPDLNANGGRDHHPSAFCSLLAGAGIKTGQVYGSSDKMGHGVQDDPVSVSDFNRTIAAAAGLPLDEEIIAPNGRPFKIGGDGTPVAGLLS